MTELSPANQYLCDAVDSAATNIELIGDSLSRAAEAITETLLSDQKLIICGNGYSTPIASLLTTCLMNQQEFERPSLPAINLATDITTISAIAQDVNYHEVYAKQIRAIGNSGDMLVALSTDGNCSNVIQAIQAAHEKSMRVITIVGQDGGNMKALKQSEDIEILLSTTSIARSMEAQLIAANTLCHLVETQLFGF